MNRYINFINQNSQYIIFLIFFLFIISIYDDYGFPNDEEISRNNGLIIYNYILEIFNINFLEKYSSLPDFKNYYDKDYGVIFELFLVIIEKTLSLENTKSIYLIRHFNFPLFFYIMHIFLSNIKIIFSKKISLIGVLIFILHPRIFAQSFYNSKDIIFLVFFCISNFYLISFFIKKNLKNILLLSIFVSLTISTRPMGLLIIPIFYFFLYHGKFKYK